MALNIKDEGTLEELRRLSQLTGQSMNKELAASIHERLERIEASGGTRLQRLLQLAEASAQAWPESMREGDPTTALYDERGLPA